MGVGSGAGPRSAGLSRANRAARAADLAAEDLPRVPGLPVTRRRPSDLMRGNRKDEQRWRLLVGDPLAVATVPGAAAPAALDGAGKRRGATWLRWSRAAGPLG